MFHSAFLPMILGAVFAFGNFLNAEKSAENLSSRALEDRIEFFYLYHDSDTIKHIVHETAALNEFGIRGFFYTALFTNYPQQAFEWISEAQVRIEDHNSLINALWAGGINDQAILRALKAGWSTDSLMKFLDHPIPALEFSIEEGGYLSCMSSNFFVTGDTRYISKIIDILDLTPEKVSFSFDLTKFKEDAEYYLSLLMYHHELVYQLCLKESKSRSWEAGYLLNTLLEKFHAHLKKASLPEQNGAFNGDILVTDSPTFEEEWETLPINSGPIGKATPSIPFPTEDIYIKIIPLFSGFELDPELNAYVTYDLDIYNPNGERICDFKGVLGLKRKAPSRFLVQAADDRKGMKFLVIPKETEKPLGGITTKPGKYTIQGTIKDQIGKKELTIIRILEIFPPKSKSK